MVVLKAHTIPETKRPREKKTTQEAKRPIVVKVEV
jgi:hypothetical protein